MAQSTPSVTVFIPTFNRAYMLKETIDSVLRQTFDDFELIISDNASDDPTESIVRSFHDKRISYVKNDKNIGMCGNWNRCFDLAKGEYIALLPDDDLMLPENLEQKVNTLSRSAQIGLVHSKFDLIDVDGRIIASNRDSWGIGERTMDCLENRKEIISHQWNPINCSSVLFRSTCFHKLGKFTEKIPSGLDYEYWLRIAVYYDVAFIARPLIRYRIHLGSETERFHSGNELSMLRTDMEVKRLLIKNHHAKIRDCRRLKREIWRKMGQRLVEFVQEMQKKGWSHDRIRIIVLKNCIEFPELVKVDTVQKVLLKSLVGQKSIDVLKRINALLVKTR